MSSIKACIQTAVFIKDILFDKLSFEEWSSVIAPKVHGSLNLHSLLPKDMDFFILLSSFSAAIEFSTQTNYAAGNTYQDAFARYRLANGQRAASLNLRPINEDGPSTGNPIVFEHIFKSDNYILQSGADLCNLLDHFGNPHLDMLYLPTPNGYQRPSWNPFPKPRGTAMDA